MTEDNEDMNVNPKSESELYEVQANVVELTEALNSDSEELKPTNSIDPTIDKPRCIIPLF